MAGLTLNAMVFKHSQYPNAAKAFLQFMLEKDQYEPWLNANCGYWSQPLAAYADASGVVRRSQGQDLQGHHEQHLLRRLQGPDLDRHRCGQRGLRAVQMFAAVATGASTPEAAAAEAEQRAKRYFRRQDR